MTTETRPQEAANKPLWDAMRHAQPTEDKSTTLLNYRRVVALTNMAYFLCHVAASALREANTTFLRYRIEMKKDELRRFSDAFRRMEAAKLSLLAVANETDHYYDQQQVQDVCNKLFRFMKLYLDRVGDSEQTYMFLESYLKNQKSQARTFFVDGAND